MHLPVGLGAGLTEGGEELAAIDRFAIDVFPAIAPAEEMLDGALVLEAELAWHGARLAGRAEECQ